MFGLPQSLRAVSRSPQVPSLYVSIPRWASGFRKTPKRPIIRSTGGFGPKRRCAVGRADAGAERRLYRAGDEPLSLSGRGAGVRVSMTDKKRHRIPPTSTERARPLRREARTPEHLPRSPLRGGQPDSLRFWHRHVIGPHAAAFFCPRRELVIELGGHSHDTIRFAPRPHFPLHHAFLEDV